MRIKTLYTYINELLPLLNPQSSLQATSTDQPSIIDSVSTIESLRIYIQHYKWAYTTINALLLGVYFQWKKITAKQYYTKCQTLSCRMIKEPIWHFKLNLPFRSILTQHNVIDSPLPFVCRWAGNSMKFFHLETSQVLSRKPLAFTENTKLHGNIIWLVWTFTDIQAR